MHKRGRLRFEEVPLEHVPIGPVGDGSPRVLSVSNDQTLLDTRTAVLQTAGFRAVGALNLAAALRALGTQSFDVLVLCHSVPQNHKDELIRVARERSPHVQVITLYAGIASQRGGADLVLDSHKGPAALIDAVRRAS